MILTCILVLAVAVLFFILGTIVTLCLFVNWLRKNGYKNLDDVPSNYEVMMLRAKD